MSAISRPWILGLSAVYHNGAACLMRGDQIVVAIQEERLTRVKRAAVPLDGSSLAVEYCLKAAGIDAKDVDVVVTSAIRGLPERPEPMRPPLLDAFRSGVEHHVIPHHLGHALSAYMTSGFEDAATIVIDGGGSFGWELPAPEQGSALDFTPHHCEHLSIYLGSGAELVPVEKHLADMSYLRTKYPHMKLFGSLGHMFSAVSQQIFGDFNEAGKVMALASYGRPRFSPGDFFEYDGKRFHFKDTAARQVCLAERWPQHQQEYFDLSTSVQQALEHALKHIVDRTVQLTGSRRLCYAGGVALNSVANHHILHHGPFDDVHIIAAAEDSGPAIGAAYYGLQQTAPKKRPSRPLTTDFLGRRYPDDEVDEAIDSFPGVALVPAADPLERVVDLLCDGHIVGWFCGGAEFGPRSLGHRAILCDPRRSDAKEVLNGRVKFREAFRPFAPCVLEEDVKDWFDVERSTLPMRYMLDICSFRSEIPEDRVPGAMHVDRTGRLQTVSEDSNPQLHALLQRFRARTGVPMLINTSLNIMGEPIVETPREALWLLLTTGVDYCVIDGRLVGKTATAESVLSLIPYKTCEIESIGPERMKLIAMSEHGPCAVWLPPELLPYINELDGRSTAREYLERIPPAIMKSSPLATLTQLHRYSLLRLRSPDGKTCTAASEHIRTRQLARAVG